MLSCEVLSVLKTDAQREQQNKVATVSKQF